MARAEVVANGCAIILMPEAQGPRFNPLHHYKPKWSSVLVEKKGWQVEELISSSITEVRKEAIRSHK